MIDLMCAAAATNKSILPSANWKEQVRRSIAIIAVRGATVSIYSFYGKISLYERLNLNINGLSPVSFSRILCPFGNGLL